MIIKIFMIMFAIIEFLNIANAQVNNESKDSLITKPEIFIGLKKAEPGDIDPGKPMMLNPSETPMYKEDYNLLEQSEFMSVMMSGDFIPEPYIDSNKVVRVFVLRKATELEKKQMEEMQNKMTNPSPLVGKKAFDFNVSDILGNNYLLKELKGKVIVMNFWFIECKPCIMEIPELNNLVEKYISKDVVFLGFSLNDKQKIESFLKSKSFNYNIIANSEKEAELYEVNSFPTHLVIDKNSTISYNVSGFTPTTIEDLDRIIESLIK